MRSIGELLGDFWAVGKIGISASLQLMAVISLPRFFVFRAPDLGDDPYPSPWIRLKASVALGEALHPHKAVLFYKDEDDTTVVAGAFPMLNVLRDMHLILSEGAHNQFGDLPWTARQEMLMEQWLLSGPEFDRFLPTRDSVVFHEPWMPRVEAYKRLRYRASRQVSIRHYRDLATFGEQLLLSIRYGNWAIDEDPNQAANWARFWRPEIQWYIHAYQAVTGVDLSAGMVDVRQAEGPGGRAAQPAMLIPGAPSQTGARQAQPRPTQLR